MSLVITIALLGLLASVSPSTIVVFILLLATARARVNAAAFLIGWSVSLTIVFAVSYAVGGVRATQMGAAAPWWRSSRSCSVLPSPFLLRGNGDAGIGPGPAQGSPRSSLARLKELHPWEAATVGVLEQPWTLTAAAAVVLVRHHSALLIVVFAFLAFALLSTATVGLIFLYFARRPGQAEAHLSDLRDRLVRAGPAIFAIVSVAVGVFLIIDGVTGIVGS